MTIKCNLTIEEVTNKRILLRDIGPWNQYITITNDAEAVVERFAPELNGRSLQYIDSEGVETELLINADGTFKGFKDL